MNRNKLNLPQGSQLYEELRAYRDPEHRRRLRLLHKALRDYGICLRPERPVVAEAVLRLLELRRRNRQLCPATNDAKMMLLWEIAQHFEELDDRDDKPTLCVRDA